MTKPTGKPHGVRDTKWQTEACREKIRTSAIVGRLQRHINGKLDMSPTQVRAAELLLSKTLPSLVSQEVAVDVATYVARLPTPAVDVTAWTKSLDTPDPVSIPIAHTSQPIDIVDVPQDNQSKGDANDEGC